MTTYSWVFVEEKRTKKSTGKTTRKLTFWLCRGNRALKSTTSDIAALKAEESILERGDEIQGCTMGEFWAEQLEKANSGLGDRFVYKIPRMTLREFNEWRQPDEPDKQQRF